MTGYTPDGVERAVQRSDAPLLDVAVAYPRWTLRRPHLYRLMYSRPLPREEVPAGIEAAAAAPIVAAFGGSPDLARAAWAFAHGMASPEIAGRFPNDADLSVAWEAGTTAIQRCVPTTHMKGPQ
jgi:hypothetical protein